MNKLLSGIGIIVMVLATSTAAFGAPHKAVQVVKHVPHQPAATHAHRQAPLKPHHKAQWVKPAPKSSAPVQQQGLSINVVIGSVTGKAK